MGVFQEGTRRAWTKRSDFDLAQVIDTIWPRCAYLESSTMTGSPFNLPTLVDPQKPPRVFFETPEHLNIYTYTTGPKWSDHCRAKNGPARRRCLASPTDNGENVLARRRFSSSSWWVAMPITAQLTCGWLKA